MIEVRIRQFVELRVKAGLSQRALARQTGLSSGYLCQLERAQRAPSPAVAKRLCESLGTEFDVLFAIKQDTLREAPADV